jgi:spore coat polysaccharide biosynthesis protein SpsF (cytidylyltransferase family)/aryl-alcohol dehydrogenase-like predicted oxidoreductase
MKSVAVIQARTSSTRLPAKVLLPIAGVPMAVLAVLRAANTGRPAILATSNESSDDVLATVAARHSITCFRGSLESPLQRIVEALASFESPTIVFRLTADNVFPDGRLLDEIQQQFVEENLAYLCCNGEDSGLPYGLSVELMRLGDLRWALETADDAFDHEHVTPLLRRRYGARYFQKYRASGHGSARCTVDCLDDYLMVQRVFEKVPNPVEVSWKKLCDVLMEDPKTPKIARPVRDLVVGTAQLGLAYGITNRIGKPQEALGKEIIRTAIRHGALFVDTARAYADSESVVGSALSTGWEGRARVLTKLSPLSKLDKDSHSSTVGEATRSSVFESCQKLRMSRLDVVMLHRASQLDDWQGRAWAELRLLKDQGVIKTLGASVQSPRELERVLQEPDVLHVQLPFNILDWRWAYLTPAIRAARAERKVTFHARSALMQGLLMCEDTSLWRRALVDEPSGFIAWLRKTTNEYARASVADLCVAYVRAHDWIDGVCVGMETLEQLEANIQLFQFPPLSSEQVEAVGLMRPVLEEKSLNPSNWRAV